MSDLLPCPFCGATPRWFDGNRFFAGELRCGCGAMFEDTGTKSSTFTAWNRRSPAVVLPGETGSQNADETKGNSHEQ